MGGHAGCEAVGTRQPKTSPSARQRKAAESSSQFIARCPLQLRADWVPSPDVPAIMNRVPGIDPLAEQNKPVFEPLLQSESFDCCPLLEEVVLRVHSLGDGMASTLENDLAGRGEMNAHIGAIDLLLDDEGFIGDELIGFSFTEMLVVIGSLGADQVRRPGVFDEYVS